MSAHKKLNYVGWPFLLLVLLTACSHQSSTDELVKELETVKSWVATAQMTGDAWTRGHVPTAYTKQSLTKTQQQLKQETKTLSKSSTAKRRAVLGQLQRLDKTIAQMATDVEQQNRTAFAQQMQLLSQEAQRLNILSQEVGGQK